MKYEDFYPLDSEIALLVMGDGSSYMRHRYIKKVIYKIIKNEVHVVKFLEVVKEGTHLRLGNYYKGKLYYSDNGMIDDIVGEQPFMTNEGLYFHRGFHIWKNNEIFLKPFDNYVILGRPTVYKKWLYFEATKKIGDTSALQWSVLRKNLISDDIEFITVGANPYVYNNILFYSVPVRHFLFKTAIYKL